MTQVERMNTDFYPAFGGISWIMSATIHPAKQENPSFCKAKKKSVFIRLILVIRVLVFFLMRLPCCSSYSLFIVPERR
jgi:hypothetical protein